jgi:cell division protein FtsB
MWTKHHKQRKFGRLVLPAITVAFLSYFGYHSVHGDLGLIATEEFERQRGARAEELAKLTARREALERQVQLKRHAGRNSPLSAQCLTGRRNRHIQ